MNNITRIFFACSILFLSSCNKDNQSEQEEDAQQLSLLINQILSLSKSNSCDNSENWSYTSIGSKACGGPHAFIPYPTTINVQSFLGLVETHKIKEHEYNLKWNISSDCSTPIEPSGVNCIDGEPVLEYDN